jgi:formimidoylglutamate deiminase
MNKTYRFENLLVGSNWQQDICVSVDQQGYISSIDNGNQTQGEAEHVSGIAMPSIANCHSHAFQYAFAGLSEYRATNTHNHQDSFWSWRNIMYQFVQQLTPDDLLVIAKKLYSDMLRAGYSSVAEFHYLHHQASGKAYDNPALMSEILIEAAQEVGIGLTLLPVYYRYAGFNQKPPITNQQRFIHQSDQYFKLLESMQGFIKRNDLQAQVKLGIAPHSLRAVDISDIQQAVAVVSELDAKAPIHIHIAEQLQEVNECLEATGMRPVEYLYEQCQVDERWCLIHATHLTAAERSMIASSKAVAGLCPTTEANLGDGLFPAQDYLAEGGAIAIGSDSHISVSVKEELRLLEYGQRLSTQKRNVLASNQQPSVGLNLYQQVAQGGAQATNRPTGEIAVGKLADICVLDAADPNLSALLATNKSQHLLDSYLFASNQSLVNKHMVAGQWLDLTGQAKQYQANYRELLTRLLG